MPQNNAQLIQDGLDALVREFRQHCLDREAGKERVTYNLNGRMFDWNTYNREVQAQILATIQLINSFAIPYAETRAG